MHVPGQLMVSSCDFCEFVVYCPKDADLFVQRFYPIKEVMLKTLIKLTDIFYLHADLFIKKMKSLPLGWVAESNVQ